MTDKPGSDDLLRRAGATEAEIMAGADELADALVLEDDRVGATAPADDEPGDDDLPADVAPPMDEAPDYDPLPPASPDA